MTSHTALPVHDASKRLDARRLLAPYTIGLITLCMALQVAIALAGQQIGWAAYLFTGVIALYYAAFLIVTRRELRRVRFAPFVAHSVTYVTVCGSFQLHAALLGFANSPVLRGDAHFPIDPGWFGPTFAMAGFWALGLIIHAVASVLQSGYEG